MFQAIHFVSRTNGWVAIDDAVGRALLRTTDGGDHWERLALVRGFTDQLKFVDAKTGWLLGSIDDPSGCVGANCSRAVLRTTDGGRTWEQEFATGELGLLGELSVADAEHAWVLQPMQACRTTFDECKERLWGTSDGSTWSQLAVVDGHSTSLDFVDAKTGWIALHTSTDASVLVTHDGGRTWTRQFEAPGSLPFLRVSFVNTLDGWALGGDIGHCSMGGCSAYSLYATTDGGSTWATLQRPEGVAWWEPTPQFAFSGGALGAPQFTSPATGWIPIETGAGGGPHGGILITADGGRTWRRSGGDAGIWSVGAIAPVDATVAVAIVRIYEGSRGTDHLVRTLDGALTWQRLSLPPTSPEAFLLMLPGACGVLSAALGTDQVDWHVDCGPAMNADARGTLGGVLERDGWRLCGSGLASSTWSKGETQLTIVESSGVPGEGFVVAQRSGPCP